MTDTTLTPRRKAAVGRFFPARTAAATGSVGKNR